MDYVWKVAAGGKVKLKDYDPAYTGKYDNRASAEQEVQELSDELAELQELLTAAQHHSLLVMLQGMDTSGKDGTIRHVLSHVNPQGCDVYSFKVPTQEELAHDFLWLRSLESPRGSISFVLPRSFRQWYWPWH